MSWEALKKISVLKSLGGGFCTSPCRLHDGDSFCVGFDSVVFVLFLFLGGGGEGGGWILFKCYNSDLVVFF